MISLSEIGGELDSAAFRTLLAGAAFPLSRGFPGPRVCLHRPDPPLIPFLHHSMDSLKKAGGLKKFG